MSKTRKPGRNLARDLLGGYKSLGDAIRANREKKELSQNKAHSEIGVSRQTLIHWENDWWTPSPEHIENIANFLEDVPKEGVATYILRMNGVIDGNTVVEFRNVNE